MDTTWAPRSLAAVMLAALMPALNIAPVAAAETALPGPVPAVVEDVYDGDTLTVRARIWIGQEVVTRVRLDGIDTPEIRGRCAAERAGAVAARDAVRALVGGRPVRLHDVALGKFAGRVVARVTTAEGRDIAGELVAAGLARRYDGGRRDPWCETAE